MYHAPRPLTVCIKVPMDGCEPLHTQATQSGLDSGWKLNVWPGHVRKRTSVFNYSLVILSIKLCKVWYINLQLHGLLMQLMWVSCDCVHWCEYELMNKVCDSKREYARGHFNIFCANFIFLLCVPLVIWGRDSVVKMKPFKTRNILVDSTPTWL